MTGVITVSSQGPALDVRVALQDGHTQVACVLGGPSSLRAGAGPWAAAESSKKLLFCIAAGGTVREVGVFVKWTLRKSEDVKKSRHEALMTCPRPLTWSQKKLDLVAYAAISPYVQNPATPKNRTQLYDLSTDKQTPDLTESGVLLAETSDLTEGDVLLAATPDLTESGVLLAETSDLTEGDVLLAETPDLTESGVLLAETPDLTEGDVLLAETELPSSGNRQNQADFSKPLLFLGLQFKGMEGPHEGGQFKGDHDVDNFFQYQKVQMVEARWCLDVTHITKEKSVDEVREHLRKKLVAAMKTGAVLWLRMGSTAVDFKNVFCHPDYFPTTLFCPELFTQKVEYLKVVRPEDTKDTSGVFVLRKKFSVLVTSSFKLQVVEDYLKDALPNFEGMAIVDVIPHSISGELQDFDDLDGKRVGAMESNIDKWKASPGIKSYDLPFSKECLEISPATQCAKHRGALQNIF
ncbi:hypothetical protein CYMTET_56259 [Cymbomonas tetramitiformis]|nr:hypothetical protein CYMTET_56259 [Cymbomonas tetramitiformis]